MILASALLLSGVSLALEPGPYEVASEDIVFNDEHAGRIWATVHHPASGGAPDLSGGPYPLAAFLHGYLGSAWMYEGACDHLASLGFVVVNMDTQTGLYLDYDDYARQTRAALRWVDAASDRPADPLAGLVSDAPWTAMGHSMGGGTLARLTELEPRIRTLVGFMPYSSDDPRDYGTLAAFDGTALYLTGTEDDTATPALVADWFLRMDNTSHGLYMVLPGLGHQAVCDLDFGEEPMSNDAQLDAVLGVAGDFLRAEVLSEPERLGNVLRTDTTLLRSNSLEPVVVAEPTDGTTVSVAVAATLGATATVYAGSGPGETAGLAGVGLSDAETVGSLDLPDGVGTIEVRLPATLDGAAWIQVVFDDEGSTPIDVFGVGAPAAEPPAGGPNDAASDELGAPAVIVATGACGGCDQTSGAAWGLLAVLPFLQRRRTRS